MIRINFWVFIFVFTFFFHMPDSYLCRRVKKLYLGEIKTLYPLTSEEELQARGLFWQSFQNVKEIAEMLRREGKKIRVSVLFPIYRKGALRIQSREETGNEVSINALREKIAQLKELFAPYSDVIDWELVVADHSPDSRGREPVERIAKEQESQGIVTPGQIRWLGLPEIEGKGETIIEGFKRLLNDKNPADIFIYTDDDLSVDLRQIGLLLRPLILDNYGVAMGSRSFKESVAEPPLDPRDAIIGKTIALLKKKFLLIPVTSQIKDTQCGFKAYKREVLEKIIDQCKDGGFTFDTEMMFHAMQAGYALKELPILWVDTPHSSVNVKSRWRMVLGWIDQYERLIRPNLEGTGYPLLSDKQLQFLRDYANQSIAAVENESEDEQLNRWNELYKIVDNWWRVLSASQEYLPDVEARLREVIQENPDAVEKLTMRFITGGKTSSSSHTVEIEVPLIGSTSDKKLKKDIQRYVEAMIVTGIVLYGATKVEIATDNPGSPLIENLKITFEEKPYLKKLGEYMKRIYGQDLIISKTETTFAPEEHTPLQEQETVSDSDGMIEGYTVGLDVGGSDIKIAVSYNTTGHSDLTYEREFRISMGTVKGGNDYFRVITTNIDFARTFIALQQKMREEEVSPEIKQLYEKACLIKDLEEEYAHSPDKAIEKIRKNFGDEIAQMIILGERRINSFVELELMEAIIQETQRLGITPVEPKAIGISWAAAVADERVAARRGKLDGGLTEEEFKTYVQELPERLKERYSSLIDVPVVVNDGDAAALLPMFSRGERKLRNVLALPIGTSLGGGYLGPEGKIVGYLMEISKAILNLDENSPLHTELGIPGVLQQIVSQDGIYNLALKYGVSGLLHDPNLRRENLKLLLSRLEKGDAEVERVFREIGIAIIMFRKFLPIDCVYLVGAVTSGKGGEVIRQGITSVVDDIEVLIGSEQERRLGQAGALAQYVAYIQN